MQGAECALTFVVHVGGHLHYAEAQVYWQVVEMVVGLQEELSSQLYIITHLIHFIDQHSIEVFILKKTDINVSSAIIITIVAIIVLFCSFALWYEFLSC